MKFTRNEEPRFSYKLVKMHQQRHNNYKYKREISIGALRKYLWRWSLVRVAWRVEKCKGSSRYLKSGIRVEWYQRNELGGLSILYTTLDSFINGIIAAHTKAFCYFQESYTSNKTNFWQLGDQLQHRKSRNKDSRGTDHQNPHGQEAPIMEDKALLCSVLWWCELTSLTEDNGNVRRMTTTPPHEITPIFYITIIREINNIDNGRIFRQHVYIWI